MRLLRFLRTPLAPPITLPLHVQAAPDNAALVEQLEAELERLRQTMSQLQRTCVAAVEAAVVLELKRLAD